MSNKYNHRRIRFVPGAEDKIEAFRKKNIVDRDRCSNTVYSEKLKFAVGLGFKNLADAIGSMGRLKFEEQFTKKH